MLLPQLVRLVWRTSMAWRAATVQSYRFFLDYATALPDNFGGGWLVILPNGAAKVTPRWQTAKLQAL